MDTQYLIIFEDGTAGTHHIVQDELERVLESHIVDVYRFENGEHQQALLDTQSGTVCWQAVKKY